ncbi:MAG TPA: thiamine pyrophosphate-binding protein [Desulfosporosinus sp.]|nr:thiamine pyrophosphate-binding protein [Desulfosporosinus sp.]
MIRVADYIAKRIADENICDVFMVTGGGAMFLNNAFGSEPRIHCIFNHHEQASAMAADGYARITGKPAVVNVTSGPGGINALNGVFGAWTDSIPMLVISGQVKRETLLSSYDLPNLRQLGDQEVDIIQMVRGITKYSKLVTDPVTIRFELEKALYLCQNGRPGPCWLDIPIDVQSFLIDEEQLLPYIGPTQDTQALSEISTQTNWVLNKIMQSNRPVILAGTGVRVANAVEIFDKVIHKLNVPVTTAWTHDLISSDDPLFCGRPGTIGTRAGNFVVQNADLVLVIGSRLNIRQVSYNWQSFAKNAFLIQVDVDEAELTKPTVKPNLGIQCDAKVFLEALDQNLEASLYKREKFDPWLEWCQERGKRFPGLTEGMKEFKGKINPYVFIDTLFLYLSETDVVVTGNASACIIPFQVAKLKKGQRLFSNSGCASMGYDLPAAIGAAIADQNRRVICLAGDGSIQMNIQELETLRRYDLNVKCFVINNNGYLSIRSSQKNFFSHLTGESPISGVSFPEITKIAAAYGIKTYRIDEKDFTRDLEHVLAESGPIICEVIVDPDQGFEPRLSSKQLPDGKIISPSIEDMYPFLSRQELLDNMIDDKDEQE